MESVIGQIMLFPYAFTPKGWAMCSGQLLSIDDNEALYSVIGNKFGGTAGSTFALPNYTGLAPAGSNYFIATTGFLPQH